MNSKTAKFCEVFGSGLSIIYAAAIASNTGMEILAFVLLFVSASLFAIWAYIDRRWAFLSLQSVYITSAIFGLIRWA